MCSQFYAVVFDKLDLYFPGSIIVTFQISGTNSSVNTTVYAVCNSIQSGQTYSFNGTSLSLAGYLTVGGTVYYGVTCGDVSYICYE